MHGHYPQSIHVLCISVSHRPQVSLCAALQSQAWPATAAREFTFPKRTKYSCESRGSYRPAGRLWCIPHLPPVWTTSPEWTTSTHQTQATGRWPQCAQHKCATVYSSEYLFQVCAHSVHCTTPSKCLYLNIVVICNVQSQRGLYGHFALFSTGTAAIPGTLWTQLWTMDSSGKADSFAHFCKNHSGNPHSKASAPNTNWRLQMEKASLPPSWYFREVVRKNLLFGQLASWPDRSHVYPSWNEKITNNFPI